MPMLNPESTLSDGGAGSGMGSTDEKEQTHSFSGHLPPAETRFPVRSPTGITLPRVRIVFCSGWPVREPWEKSDTPV
jgi:hypothetical protein